MKGALVLEGGSLRGMFTAGVLDVLMERNIWLEYVNGVSAGALNAINYVSRQIGRSEKVNVGFVCDKRYLGLNNLIFHGGIFNFDFLFGEIADSLLPFDEASFNASAQILECVATDCETGAPVYFRRGECPDIMRAARASASMPLLSRAVEIEGRSYLDGGSSMPIAYRRALELGYDRVVLVLTREQGYRKTSEDKLFARMYDRFYGQNPGFVEALHHIPDRYNAMQEEIDRLTSEGKLFVIRPEQPVEISRIERDTEKLEALYQRGRSVAEKRLAAMLEYLEG